ncbi:XRE family transcriptional regulator [Sinorhizobium fredii]|uniref:XRE family transcriptional regulator n=1 Tax=Rhizobium fredii TaxID=380 RepID=UPI003515179F
MPGDVAEIASMINRLEAAGFTRREIAAGSKTSPSSVTRLANLDARKPSFKVVSSIKMFYRQQFPNAEPPQRFAPGCAPRASR